MSNQNLEQPYLLTVHVNGEEETFTFPTLESRDAFVKEMQQQEDVNISPMIADDQWGDYQKRRNKMLDDGGVFVDLYEEDGVSKAKFSYSEEAYEKIEKDATEQGVSVDELMAQDLKKYTDDATVLSEKVLMSRQQRRLLERRAKKQKTENR